MMRLLTRLPPIGVAARPTCLNCGAGFAPESRFNRLCERCGGAAVVGRVAAVPSPAKAAAMRLRRYEHVKLSLYPDVRGAGQLMLSLQRDVMRALGWRAGSAVVLSLDARDRLRLTPGAARQHCHSLSAIGTGEGGANLRCAIWPGVERVRRPAEACAWRRDGGDLVVELPDWARVEALR